MYDSPLNLKLTDFFLQTSGPQMNKAVTIGRGPGISTASMNVTLSSYHRTQEQIEPPKKSHSEA